MPEADAAGRGSLSPGEFGTAFKAFLEQSTAQAPRAEPELAGSAATSAPTRPPCRS